MSEHKAIIEWTLAGPDFSKFQYSREHTWSFDGGVRVPASASPSIVPLPWSSPAGVDPEEAFVAAVASCHMLSWLPLVAKRGFVVEAYRDEAVGEMARNKNGVLWIARVTLNPRVTYGARVPTPAEESELHELAHEHCFIASSIKTEVVVRASKV